MQQSQDGREHKIHCGQRRFFTGLVVAEDFGLGRFNKPIAVIAPNKIIKALPDRVELVIAIRHVNPINRFV